MRLRKVLNFLSHISEEYPNQENVTYKAKLFLSLTLKLLTFAILRSRI